MHPKALVDLSTELLRAVLKLDQPADGVVSAFFRQHRALGSRERHALAETAYTVLRQRLLFQNLAQSGTGPLERRLVLLAWQGTPNYLLAATEAHEQAWLDKIRQIDPATLPEKQRHNLPDWLAAPLKDTMGDDFWPLVQALNEAAPLDLRVNVLKAKRDEVRQALADAGLAAEPTPHSPWGLRLHGKPALHKLDVFTRGLVEVQDEGSQLLALITDAKRGEMVVDFCAGAGGKTLALGAAMRNTGRLYAFDVSGHRLDALKPRLARSGLSNVHPAQIAHERDDRIKRLAGKIDRVLVDAPCSGLGTLRRNPDLKWRQSPKAVEELQAKQTAILASAARLLKPGGRLVYATCSLLAAENEAVAEAFTAANAAQFEVLPALQALEAARVEAPAPLVAGPYLRLWPHRHQTDGFFAAAWQKR
ncbi:RsmB/NOP family class I SAM-dependent RNA methyltransferase [Rubrivivax rivuli]|uniref:RsmB/NOP family class I SAM-dependent RNA methyltransferase n=1 Tax=Rubrivivax rivuli TaxID=1862385 RepID=A0A437RKG9_9BURK|nr:RsmB/NOP family class I SAM-dependent RNA methyltransferase [Rubrivivax rivuli]RVU47125.1 RsmB/NOP family class I SAM-dependent RNA methyltransferase [Rubrivivax rivuli]